MVWFFFLLKWTFPQEMIQKWMFLFWNNTQKKQKTAQEPRNIKQAEVISPHWKISSLVLRKQGLWNFIIDKNDLIRGRYHLAITLKSHTLKPNAQRLNQKPHMLQTYIIWTTDAAVCSQNSTDKINWLAYMFPLRNISHSEGCCWCLLYDRLFAPQTHSSKFSLISAALEK